MLGEIAGVITAFLWAFTALAFEDAAKKIGANNVNSLRLVLAVLYLSVTVYFLDLDYQLSTEQIIWLAISGVIGLSLGDAFLFHAFQEIGSQISMLFMALAPVFATILAFIFLGEQLTAMNILGILTTIGGIVMVIFDPDSIVARSISRKGLFFAIMAALGQGVGLIFAKKAFQLGEINGFVASFYRILFAALFTLPLMLLNQHMRRQLRSLTLRSRGTRSLLIGSIIGPYLGITFSLIAVKHTLVGIASTLMATVPILLLPLNYFIHGLRFKLREVVGTVVTVIGVAVLFLQ